MVRLPLHLDLRDMLISYFEACGSPSSSTRALKVPPRLRAFDRDLKAAGIPKMDERGIVADLHSMRHSTASSCEIPPPRRPSRYFSCMETANLSASDAIGKNRRTRFPVLVMIPGIETIHPSGTLIASNFGVSVIQIYCHQLPLRVKQNKSHQTKTTIFQGKMAPAVGIEPTT